MPPNIKGAGKRMNTLRQLCKVCLFSLEIASIMASKVNSTNKIYIGKKMTTAPTPLIYSRSNVGGDTYINSTPPLPPCILSLPRPRLLLVALSLSLHFPVPFPNILLPPLPLPPSPSFCVMILETARHRRRSDADTPVHSSDIHLVPTPVPHDTSESLSLRCPVAVT